MSPSLCRLEYLTANGWSVGHAGVALLHPDRYVERLTARGKFGRATVLDERLQPTDEVYVSPDLPDDLSLLVKVDTDIPTLVELCPVCDEAHPAPYDGSCLL